MTSEKILLKQVRILEQVKERGEINEQGKTNERTDIAIADGKICAIGTVPEDFKADTVIDGSHKTVLPGLVNAHTHVYMSVFRNYADDVPFETWLFGKIAPMEDRMTPEDAYWGCMLSFAEMIRSGTTAFLDMHMFPRTVVRAAHDAGLRAVLSRGLQGTDRTDQGIIRRINEAKDEMEYAKEIGSIATFMISPHAIYTCGEDALRYALETAEELQIPVHIHMAETRKEYEDCLAQRGMTPVRYVDSLGLLDHKIVLAHCVRLADEDYPLLAKPLVAVAANPASNAKLANGIAPVARMLREGVCVSLGTDGASSNNSQNMFTDMHLLSLLAKASEEDSLVLPAKETLQIATANGYRALGLDQNLGKIEEGYTADLILINEDAPSLLPHFDMASALVYSANGSEVSDVIVNGKLLMKDRELLTIDEEKIRFEISRITAQFP